MSVVRYIQLDLNESFAPLDEMGGKDKVISASDMLKAFCVWQRQLNDEYVKDREEYDVALLLTRYEINLLVTSVKMFSLF